MKRAYEAASSDDGYRVLVDRLWPRGVRKESLRVEEWLKDLAPSTELRKWFNHDPERFQEFKKRYQEELKNQKDELKRLKEIAAGRTLTLVYSAKEPQLSQAVVLQGVLERMK